MSQVKIKEHMFTIAQVAEALSVSRRTVERLIKRGDLRAYQVGGQKRIPPVAVEQMLRKVELPNNYDTTWQKLDLF
jgi:excisionase family DNA binding protein